MSGTTLMPVDPAMSPQRVTRVLTISANLLPEEVIAARRVRRTRGWLLVVLAVVLLMVGGWYGHAVAQTSQATEEFEDVTQSATTLQQEQTRYADVVDVQADIATLSRQLKAAMAADLPWAVLLEDLQSTGSASGVTVDGVNALLDNDAAGATGSTASGELPSTSKAATVGSAVVSGVAPDKASVAKYVEALAQVNGVANPYLTSATETTGGDVQFSLRLDISADALCGKFTTKCKTAGGN